MEEEKKKDNVLEKEEEYYSGLVSCMLRDKGECESGDLLFHGKGFN